MRDEDVLSILMRGAAVLLLIGVVSSSPNQIYWLVIDVDYGIFSLIAYIVFVFGSVSGVAIVLWLKAPPLYIARVGFGGIQCVKCVLLFAGLFFFLEGMYSLAIGVAERFSDSDIARIAYGAHEAKIAIASGIINLCIGFGLMSGYYTAGRVLRE